MADAITIKALQDASLDAKSLSEFVFKPASFMVQRRLAPTINTLQYYIDLFENISIGGEFNSAKIESLTVTTSAAGTEAAVITGGTPSNRTFALTIPRGDKGVDGKSAYQSALDNGFIGTEAEWKLYLKSDGSIQALQQFMTNDAATEVSVPDYGNTPSLQGYISTMFENGGLPATPFATKALMTASALANDKYAMVTDDTTNKNGIYIKQAGVWVKSAYDPTTLALSKVENTFETYDLMVSSPLPDGSKSQVYGDIRDKNGSYKKTNGAWLRTKYNPTSGVLVESDPQDDVAFAILGANGKSPLSINDNGVVDQPVITTGEINGTKYTNPDPWGSGFVWAITGDDDKAPIAIDGQGTVHIDSLKVNTINADDIDSANNDAAILKATHEWWIYPVHTQLTEPYERIVSGAYGEGGEILVCETIPDLGNVKRIELDKSKDNLVDDHEAPALYAENGRRMVLAWGRSVTYDNIHIYVSDQGGDIESFLDKPVTLIPTGPVSGTSGSTTYNQIVKLPKSTDTDDYFWIFGLNTNQGWGAVEIQVNQQTGDVTLVQPWVRLFNRTGYISTAESNDGTNTLRLAHCMNPASSYNDMSYLEINKITGDITMPSDESINANIDGTNLPISLTPSNATLPDIKPDGFSRRLHYMRAGPSNPAILYAEWATDTPDVVTYKTAVFDGLVWTVREHGNSGSRFGFMDTSNYIAGGCFPDPCYSDMLYLARHDDTTGISTLEEVRVRDGVDVSRKVVEVENNRITRPFSPKNGSANLVYSEVSQYSATGFTFKANIKFINKFRSV